MFINILVLFEIFALFVVPAKAGVQLRPENSNRIGIIYAKTFAFQFI